MQKPYFSQYYREQIVPALMKSRGYKNIHEVPQIQKVVLNTGFSAVIDKGGIDEIQKDLSKIAGQKAVITKARRSVSNFKLREGMPIGAMVTLRGYRMYDFLYRMISVALPGIRDFRGVNDRMDGNGNYTLGISDHTIFPETHSDGNKRVIGMDICIVTTAMTDDEGRELLAAFGMPFRKKNPSATQAATA